MFVYQDKAGNICVTFQDNKPVEAPEYVIAISEEDKALYMVSGEIASMPVEEDTTDTETEVEDTTEEPEVEVTETPVTDEEPTEDSTEEESAE